MDLLNQWDPVVRTVIFISAAVVICLLIITIQSRHERRVERNDEKEQKAAENQRKGLLIARELIKVKRCRGCGCTYQDSWFGSGIESLEDYQYKAGISENVFRKSKALIHCTQCGGKIISECEKCGLLLPRAVELEYGKIRYLDNNCANCGTPFPWTKKKVCT
ncbi:MAG: DUF2321 domain-containing protein [Patescibacteria group bacterium]